MPGSDSQQSNCGKDQQMSHHFDSSIFVSVSVPLDLAYGAWPENAAQETFGCQLTNAPFGFGFHAQTCNV